MTKAPYEVSCEGKKVETVFDEVNKVLTFKAEAGKTYILKCTFSK